VNSDSVTVIAVPGAAAAVPAEVDGTAVVAGLLLPLLQPARVSAAAMKISPRRGFIVVPSETKWFCIHERHGRANSSSSSTQDPLAEKIVAFTSRTR
jgi:hypothetical protein